MNSSSTRLTDVARLRISEWTRVAALRFGLQNASTLDQWRGRILAALLGAALVLGGPPFILALYIFMSRGLWPMIAVDVAAVSTVIYLLFSRGPSFRVRAWAVILAMLTIGSMTMFLAGFRTAGAVWLSMGALSAGLLLGVRAGVGVVAYNILLFTAIGVGISHGAMPWAIGVPDALMIWILSSANTSTLGLMTTVSVGVLINGLEREAEARHRAEDERQKGQHLEALGTLAGGIAHDFNNLLAPILANVELLTLDAVPDQRDLLDDVRTSAERGREMVRRLLSLHRGDVPECVSSDVATVVREVERLVRAHATREVVVSVRVTPAPPVRASHTELHQIIMNLATNAVHAMGDRGELVLEIDMVSARSRLMTRLRVRDTGSGMSPEVVARAFDPFFTTKGAQQGTGLGLATVHALVSSLGGTITIDSVVGVGTTVSVCLPGVYADGTTSALDIVPHRATPTVRHVPSLVVLVVDDEPVVLESARRVLTTMGHRAIVMSSAAAAERWFEQHASECDIVITDHRMPGHTGSELIAALRRVRPDIPAVVVSGYIDEARKDVRALGASTVLLAKPYDIAQLQSAIRDVLRVTVSAL